MIGTWEENILYSCDKYEHLEKKKSWSLILGLGGKSGKAAIVRKRIPFVIDEG